MTEIIKLPGLVDLHVHLRDPGQTQKEDFYTGTQAALAGGYTAVYDMPNNAEAITTVKLLKAKIASARRQIVADVGFHFGSLGDNLDQFAGAMKLTSGLKLYLNVTTGNYLLDPAHLEKIFRAWSSPKPILLHAEADVIKTALKVTAKTGQATHVCHVSSRAELLPILEAKKAGLPVSCGITPHHLFLNASDEKRLGNYGMMKPSLKPQADVDYLWSNLDQVDAIESDHAPHTRSEKDEGAFGVPGLETTLPLLLQAEREGKISREAIIAKCSTNPRKIIGLKADPTSHVEVSAGEFVIKNEDLKTKCGWSPFAGQTAFGRVQKVILRGQTVFENDEVMAKPGSGRIL
ncbi:MAG TPA: dihydroorotase family protein [Candidatus Saccharimonadales bacterium]|nr:dihydroorotase family protein [Candidatus Saccharimonadales bacterium]